MYIWKVMMSHVRVTGYLLTVFSRPRVLQDMLFFASPYPLECFPVFWFEAYHPSLLPFPFAVFEYTMHIPYIRT